ncbi:MAG: hypothetical protein ACOC79_01450, partial [Thermodesulfobacteriota bacterium]
EILVTDRTHRDAGDVPPVHGLLKSGRDQQIIKDLPLGVLLALAFAPIVFVARDVSTGVLEMEPETVQKIIEACWDAIKR